MERLVVRVKAEMEKVDKAVKLPGPLRETDAIRRHRRDEFKPLCLPEKQGQIAVQQRLSSCKVDKGASGLLGRGQIGHHVVAAGVGLGHIFPYGAESARGVAPVGDEVVEEDGFHSFLLFHSTFGVMRKENRNTTVSTSINA